MRPSRLALIWAAFAALATGGCSTTEGRCEDFCQYIDDCGLDPNSNCAANCEANYDDASDACQEAFDDLADCLSDHDLECSNACDGDFLEWGTDCAGQFG